jgi:hypothetical protein
MESLKNKKPKSPIAMIYFHHGSDSGSDSSSGVLSDWCIIVGSVGRHCGANLVHKSGKVK